MIILYVILDVGGVKYYSKLQQSYQYLHPSKHENCSMLLLLLLVIILSERIQTFKGKEVKLGHETQRRDCTTWKEENKSQKEKEIKRYGVKTTHSLCGNSVRIFDKIDLKEMWFFFPGGHVNFSIQLCCGFYLVPPDFLTLSVHLWD